MMRGLRRGRYHVERFHVTSGGGWQITGRWLVTDTGTWYLGLRPQAPRLMPFQWLPGYRAYR